MRSRTTRPQSAKKLAVKCISSRAAIPTSTLRLRISVGSLTIVQVLGVGGAELDARVDYIVSRGGSSTKLVPVRWQERPGKTKQWFFNCTTGRCREGDENLEVESLGRKTMPMNHELCGKSGVLGP